MRAVTWPQVLAWRMRRQFLEPGGEAPPSRIPAAALVGRLAGVQAQVVPAAELAVAVRRAEPVPGEVPRALWEERSLVRTWAARGTLHLLPAADAPAYLALCAAGRPWEKASWQKAFGATPADLEAIAGAARSALSGGAELTRAELITAILDETGAHHLAEILTSGWGTLLKPLAWWGVLCHGPARGAQTTFGAPEHTVPGWTAPPPPEEAARTVVPAFLGAHGPAAPETFDAWLTRGKSRRKDLRSWFAAVEDLLAEVEVEGVPMLVPRDHLDGLLDTPPTRSVRLVGGFDQYVLGAGTGAAYLVPPDRRADVSRTGGWIAPVVLHGGRVAGVWEAAGGRIEVTPFEDVPAGPLEKEIARMRALLAS